MKLTIPVRKAGRSIQVDLARLAEFSGIAEEHRSTVAADLENVLANSPKLAYVLAYGLTQSLNDAHAAEGKKTAATPESIMALVEKKLAAIYDGTIRVKGSGTAVNPVEREALKISRAWWKSKGEVQQNAAIGKMRTRDTYAEMDDKDIAQAIIEAYAKSAGVVEKAQAIVAVNQKKVEDDFDIDELLGEEETEESDEETDTE